MTPSEVADWLEDHGKRHTPWCDRYAQAGATIRTQAEALKIATEALAYVSEYSPGRNPANVWSGTDHTRKYATQALARIKEV